jgi:hypothetical protein
MLRSPATKRRKSKNNRSTTSLDRQLLSCEARRALVLARAREPSNQRNRRRGAPNRHFETPEGLIARPPASAELHKRPVRLVAPICAFPPSLWRSQSHQDEPAILET